MGANARRVRRRERRKVGGTGARFPPATPLDAPVGEDAHLQAAAEPGADEGLDIFHEPEHEPAQEAEPGVADELRTGSESAAGAVPDGEPAGGADDVAEPADGVGLQVEADTVAEPAEPADERDPSAGQAGEETAVDTAEGDVGRDHGTGEPAEPEAVEPQAEPAADSQDEAAVEPEPDPEPEPVPAIATALAPGPSPAPELPEVTEPERANALLEPEERIESAPDDFGADDVKSWVRPYVWTGGRTDSSLKFALETLVSASKTQPTGDEMMRDEHRRVLELCDQPRSVSEIAALLSVPFGVAKTLLGVMAEQEMLVVHDNNGSGDGGPDLALMERVLRGLKNL